MCLAKAYIIHDDGYKMVAENVASAKFDGTNLILTTILRETRTLKADIEHIDFANGNLKLRLTKWRFTRSPRTGLLVLMKQCCELRHWSFR